MCVQSLRRLVVAFGVVSVCSSGADVALGQTSAQPDTNRPPSNPTVLGDTGLWFVPSAEVLPGGQWSLSTFRVNTDREQGFTDVSHFAAGGAIGIKDRVEVFGAMNAQTRIDRDLRPLNMADQPSAGGLDRDYPFVRDGFSRGRGDLSLGAKLNLLSETRGDPAAFAVRSVVKLPTGDRERGVSTGETDVVVDAIASRYVGNIEVAGFGGAIARGDASGVDLPNGIRWGLGAGFPAPARIRVITEVRGEVALGDDVVARQPFVARDGSLAPLRSLVRNPVDALLGVTWQAPGGVFVGAGISWAARFHARDRFAVPGGSGIGDRVGLQMGLGFRPGRRDAILPLATAAPVEPRPTARPVEPSPAPPSVADAPPLTLVFEDVHFEFDQYTLRSDSLRVLDEAVQALAATPALAVTIDGHTCNIGTAEYNLALADRRAHAVREYLVTKGVDPARLTTIAYGEERPGFDNTREESRRRNRRAALVVELGQPQAQ